MNTSAVVRYLGNPAATRFGVAATQSAAPVAAPIPAGHDEANLAVVLRGINKLSPEKRLPSVLSALSGYFDRKAATSPDPNALPFASGFRTIEQSIHRLSGVSITTAQTLGSFLGVWFLALLEERVAMNSPRIQSEHENEDLALSLSWRREDRTFEVSIVGVTATYQATSFTVDRRLELQEGGLDLSVPAMRRTVSWLVGIPAES